jgi:ADP-ribosylglycohydrolase
MINRCRGTLIGLPVGDVLGAVDFKSPRSFALATGYRCGGPHGLDAGKGTDDTRMTLALDAATANHDFNLGIIPRGSEGEEPREFCCIR